MNKPQQIAALYARVSTKTQEKEATIESQVSHLLSFGAKHNYSMPDAHRYIDQAVSGKQLARGGLDCLRDNALTGAFTVLLCLSPDRLARDLGMQRYVLDELGRAGVKVVFSNQPERGDSPQDRLLLDIQAAFADYERTAISERMRRGRLHRLRRGASAPYPAPYGYDYRPRTTMSESCWEINEAQAPVVQQIFHWYTSETVSMYQIAQRLNKQKTPSPQGGNWTQATLQRLLAHPAYKGQAVTNRRRADYSQVGQLRKQGQGRIQTPRYKQRAREEWIYCTVPVIIDESMWDQAQQSRRNNAQHASRNAHRTYLLRGLLVCAVCGHTLYGRTYKQSQHYRCPNGGKRRPDGVLAHSCSIAADVIEPLVWQVLADLLENPQHIYAAWEAHLSQQKIVFHEIQLWQQRLDQLQAQRQRLLDAYQNSLCSLQELTDRLNPLKQETQSLRAKLSRSQPQTKTDIDLDAYTHHISHILSTPDVSTQQEVIRLLIERIIVATNSVTVEHIVPTRSELQLEPALFDT